MRSLRCAEKGSAFWCARSTARPLHKHGCVRRRSWPVSCNAGGAHARAGVDCRNCTMSAQTRLVVVSNRLPYVFERDAGGTWNARPGSGGLVTALLPVLRNRGGVWIGWAGTTEADDEVALAAEKASGSAGYVLKTVSLT